MKVKSFIEKIKAYLDLHKFEKKGKKKSVAILLEKLKSKHSEISQKLKENRDQKELQEELDIISIHIKKAEKILEKLNS